MDNLVRDLLMDCIDEFGFEKNLWFNLGIIADKLEENGEDINLIVGLRYGHQHRKHPLVRKLNQGRYASSWHSGANGEWNLHYEIDSKIHQTIHPTVAYSENHENGFAGSVLCLYRRLGVALLEKQSRENNYE